MDLAGAVSGSSIAGVDTFQDIENQLVIALGLTDEPKQSDLDKADADDKSDDEPDLDGADEDKSGPGSKDCPVPDPKTNPHPEVAVKDVDTSKLPDSVKWRDTDEPLYRFDDRPPDEVFVDDFEPKNPDNMELYDYVKNNNRDSGFVSTTTKNKPVPFYGQDYRYDIDVPGGIDVNKTFGPNSPHPGESEIAFPGGIDSKYIKGAWKLDSTGKPTGEFIENPYYESPEERGED